MFLSHIIFRVSPANSSKRSSGRKTRVQQQVIINQLDLNISSLQSRPKDDINNLVNSQFSPMHTATQTTFVSMSNRRVPSHKGAKPHFIKQVSKNLYLKILIS